MGRYLIDLEGNGLLDTVDRLWIIGGVDLDTNEEFYHLEGDLGWIDKLSKAELLVGHNLIDYDLPALAKVHKWKPSKETTIHDTLIMSQSQNFRRFPNSRHGVDAWGSFFGTPKIEFDAFHQYSEEMLAYWRGDIAIQTKIYNYLLKELENLLLKKPEYKIAFENEHIVAEFCAKAHIAGWKFNKEKAIALLEKMALEMESTAAIIEPKLLLRTVAVDAKPTKGEYPWKSPRWIKNGCYDAHTARWFDIPPEMGREDPIILGDYSRITFHKPDMSNMEDIKIYLFSIGWEPDEWNWKRDPDTGRLEKTSPKLSEESLFALGEDGRLISEYMTTKSRYGILKHWIEALDENGRLHGSCNTFGTPTGRATHKVIANVPAVESTWGAEIRELFMADEGYKIIGADSSGNQFRALCHYLKNDDYTALVLEGDVHAENANILTEILRDLGVYSNEQTVARKTAKPFIYAFLFGAGGEKLSLIVLNKRNRNIGNKLKQAFIEKVPGLSNIVGKLNRIFDNTCFKGQFGWIPGLDGTRIYVDSRHKTLNYLLQKFESVTCKAALAYAVKKLEAENIPYIPLIWYHDEFEFEVPEAYAERSLEISIEAYRESGKVFNAKILDGAGKIGDSWKDVH